MNDATPACNLVANADSSQPNACPRGVLLAIILLALLIRIPLCLQPACVSRDGAHFVGYAKKLAADPVRWMLIETKQPGFAFLLLGTHRLLGPWVGGDAPEAWQRSGELLALVGGVGACACIYLLTRRLFDPSIAAAAGILACFWPQGAHLSADTLSDMPHLPLYLAALIVAIDALNGRPWWRFAACGFLIGLAYMLRQEALGLLAAITVFILCSRNLQPRRRRITSLAALLVPFVLVVAPYSIACGRIMPNKGPQDLLDASQDATGSADVDPAAALPAWREMPEVKAPILTPGLAATVPGWRALLTMAEHWAKSGRYVFSTLFLIALILRTVPMAEPTGKRLILAVVFIHVVLVQARLMRYGETSSRYMVIPAALCLPWAAAALVTILRRITTRLDRPTSLCIASVWIVGWLAALAVPACYLARPVNHADRPYRAAGLWLGAHADPADRILAHERLDQIMFYAGRGWPDDDKWLRLKETDGLDAIRRALRRKSPAWFVDSTGSRRAVFDEKAHFEALNGGAVPELQPVHSTGASGRMVYVFRVSAPAAPR